MADADSRKGKRYADAALMGYADALHVSHDAVLRAAFDAPEEHGVPAIQLGPSEAGFLGLLLRIAGARKVVEVGTLVGYSGIHIARALPEDGHLWTLEKDPLHAELARTHFEQAGLDSQVSVMVGDAAELLLQLGESCAPFDAVFIDADKAGYPRYRDWAAARLAPGGLLVADNAYLFGHLLDPDAPQSEAMRDFHEGLAEHFDAVCLPTPDGLVVARRR